MRPIARAIGGFWDASGAAIAARPGDDVSALPSPASIWSTRTSRSITTSTTTRSTGQSGPKRCVRSSVPPSAGPRRRSASPGPAPRRSARRCPRRPRRSIIIPHGTPRAFLADRPLDRPAPPPADIAHLPRPLLGYVGSIEGRADWPLMERIEREHSRVRRSCSWARRPRRRPREPWYAACARVPGPAQRPRDRLAAPVGPARPITAPST